MVRQSKSHGTMSVTRHSYSRSRPRMISQSICKLLSDGIRSRHDHKWSSRLRVSANVCNIFTLGGGLHSRCPPCPYRRASNAFWKSRPPECDTLGRRPGLSAATPHLH